MSKTWVCVALGALVAAGCAAPPAEGQDAELPSASADALAGTVTPTAPGETGSSAGPSPSASALPTMLEFSASGWVLDGPIEGDSDGDGLPDDREAQVGTDPANPDTDGDGLGDLEELVMSITDPLTSATYDGVPDGDSDLDGDGLGYLAERQAGTDPLERDTDGDGVDDGEEVVSGTDPLNVDDPARPTRDGAAVIYDGGEQEVSIVADVDNEMARRMRGIVDNGHVGWVDVPSMLASPASVDVAEDGTEVTFVYPPAVTQGRTPDQLLVAFESIETFEFLEPVAGATAGEAQVTVTVNAGDFPTVVLLDREAHLALLE